MHKTLQIKHNNTIMNQILQTSLNSKKNNNKRRIILIQFFISLLLFFFTGFYYGLINYKKYQQENYSRIILKNYNITRLYLNYQSNLKKELKNNIDNNNFHSNIIGVLKIPSINIEYPIFANYDKELLKISPCKFYGSLPGKNGNLCIAGHNYNNKQFFSQIINLKINDIIYLYDSLNKEFKYTVFDNYEVKSDNLSPIYSTPKNSKELTLITCNNLNGNRIIIKAKIIT